MLRYIIIAPIFLLAFAAVTQAQEPPCGVHAVSEQSEPIYPPIARAAHVSGDVLLAVTFNHDGGARDVRAIRGPEMLKKPAMDFVQHWHANPDEGTRSCLVTIQYTFSDFPGCDNSAPAPSPALIAASIRNTTT